MRRSTESTSAELALVRAEADAAASTLAEARKCENLLKEVAGIDIRAAGKTDERAKQFREMLDHTQVLCLHFDLRNRNYFYSRAAREFRHYQGDPAESNVVDIISSGIHAEDRDRVRRTLQAAMSRVSQEKFSEILEYRRLCRRTEYRWLYEKFTFIPDQFGNISTLVSSAVDITPQKEALAALRENESRYRTLTELCQDVFWIVGLDYKTVFVSSSTVKLLGYTPDELRRMPLDAFMLQESAEKTIAVATEYFAKEAESAGPSMPVRFEACYRRKDGTTFWGEVTFTAYRDDAERFLGICGTTRDITERRMVQEELEQTHRELEERVRDRTKELRSINRKLKSEMERRKRIEQFMLHYPEQKRAAIGKELNDGLCREIAGIMCLCEGVRENLLGQDEIAVKELSDIRDLLADAVKQAREIANGLNPLIADPMALVSSLKALAEKTTSLFRVRCVFTCNSPSECGIDNSSQALGFYRIAQEAVHNAIRHGNARNIEILLRTDSGNMQLTVSDDGCGRAGKTENPKGMGLKIMAYRMQAMEGTLRLLDRPEGGMIVDCSAPKR